MSTIQSSISKRNLLMMRNRSGSQGTNEVNLALIGELGSGKSALTVKYITRRFINEYDPELEDTYSKPEHVDNQDILVRIMDTCDKEGKDPERYLKWADGYLVIYSITQRSSFETAQRYLDGISQHLRLTTTYDAPLILIGNKVDLERYRTVSKPEGSSLAHFYNAAFFETSAAEEFSSVERVFHEAIREVIREQERYMPIRSLYFGNEESKSGNSFLTHIDRSRRLRSPGVIHHGSKNGQSSSSSSSASKDGSSSSRPEAAGNNSRFSFLKGKGFKGIFQ
ncbi:ras-like protein family member 12 isoform X1 [Daphnia pulicaria]|uniref:ras-like protein family member 12 isoform X1 n=2 Tax=Daphnia pulicaria TaxID=35523 RepID=UPI001EECD4B0|nr:ras-like protein family member 12 isoform X1 [Daphnia pulicaria]